MELDLASLEDHRSLRRMSFLTRLAVLVSVAITVLVSTTLWYLIGHRRSAESRQRDLTALQMTTNSLAVQISNAFSDVWHESESGQTPPQWSSIVTSSVLEQLRASHDHELVAQVESTGPELVALQDLYERSATVSQLLTDLRNRKAAKLQAVEKSLAKLHDELAQRKGAAILELVPFLQADPAAGRVSRLLSRSIQLQSLRNDVHDLQLTAFHISSADGLDRLYDLKENSLGPAFTRLQSQVADGTDPQIGRIEPDPARELLSQVATELLGDQFHWDPLQQVVSYNGDGLFGLQIQLVRVKTNRIDLRTDTKKHLSTLDGQLARIAETSRRSEVRQISALESFLAATWTMTLILGIAGLGFAVLICWQLPRTLREQTGRFRQFADMLRVTNSELIAEISSRREAQQQCELSRHSAEIANRAKSEFLANMSHEIRTPLTAILGFSEVLDDEIGDSSRSAQVGECLTTIKSAGRHLCEIIDDILDLSKIEAGRVATETVDTNVPEVVRNVVDTFAARASQLGLTLTLQMSEEVPPACLTDPTRLRQILMNLISNAIKFTKIGGVRIDGSTVNADRHSWLRFDVSDSGVGMTPEQAQRLFQPFTQADSSTTRQYGGTGLGLAISRKLARLLGGDLILLKTEPENGTTFRLEIPLVRNNETTHTPSAPGEISPIRSSTPPHQQLSGRILLVEDCDDLRRLIAFQLGKAGATVHTAGNGAEALAAHVSAREQRSPYDPIVTDMQMPVMDGYSLVKQLRRDGDATPVIALTAAAMRNDEARCRDAGCDDYCSKPVDRETLIAQCQRWINSKSAVVAGGIDVVS